MVQWGFYRSLESSFYDFLKLAVQTDNLKDINGNFIPIYIGRMNSTDWKLPCISVYFESEVGNRLEVGSNLRDDKQLIIIDMFATNEGERLELANWVKNTINNGFPYYIYSGNPINPDSPIKVFQRNAHLDFLTNGRVNLGQTIDEIDAHRHQITVNVYLTGA